MLTVVSLNTKTSFEKWKDCWLYFFLQGDTCIALHVLCNRRCCAPLLLPSKKTFMSTGLVTITARARPVLCCTVLLGTTFNAMGKAFKLPLILLACTTVWTVARVQPFNSYWTVSLLTSHVHVHNLFVHWPASKMWEKKKKKKLAFESWSALIIVVQTDDCVL